MSARPSPEPAAAVTPLWFGDRVLALLDRCTFPPPGTPVRCGASGGADSSALVVLAVAWGCAVTAVHVDHGLRPDSAAEADAVAALAARVGAGFEQATVVVEPGPNLEERARTARHRVLGPDALLGHTADDQAETVLLALVRGTGLHGLAGMAPGPRHPILGLRRHETLEVCDSLGLTVVEDPSNDDPRFRRNRIRHEVLPLLADVADREVVPLIVRTAQAARQATAQLDEEAAALDPTDARALVAAPDVLAVLALRRWLRDGDPLGHPPDAAALGRAMAVARGEARACELAGGRRLERSAGRLRLVDATAEEPVDATTEEPVDGSAGASWRSTLRPQ